ncbi:hypothetical protein K469DRAFT_726694 [Zopfia rhizophila CBS 207.26]|uniref:DUF1996 domain-containing protein n=1 Tax=Zopfia rhizophila CBS 207.26 TaxID=1314779 RepID=A0A6A6E0W6_9PEZI|nr:hypothetical protein K469DRAFT_726694 [Zopfia rhizophila CBS 207.26]
MQWISLVALALIVPNIHAGMLLFACSQLVTERSDPLTAVLYFCAHNGTYKRVPIIANQYLETANAGMTVYYISLDNDKTTKVTAFKPGFRMLAGTAEQHKKDNEFVNLYRCYDKPNFQSNPMGVPATDTSDLPKKHCAGGIRVNTFFPTCWGGKNLDNPNSSEPHRIPCRRVEPEMPVEPSFAWAEDGSQPFVFSQGDPTGFGHHADYVFGWKGDSLQKAMDARCNFNCPQLKSQSQAAANRCSKQQTANLPGGMPVKY